APTAAGPSAPARSARRPPARIPHPFRAPAPYDSIQSMMAGTGPDPIVEAQSGPTSRDGARINPADAAWPRAGPQARTLPRRMRTQGDRTVQPTFYADAAAQQAR